MLTVEAEKELRRREARAARLGRYLKAFTAAKRIPSERLWLAYFRAELSAWEISRGWYSANRPGITAYIDPARRPNWGHGYTIREQEG